MKTLVSLLFCSVVAVTYAQQPDYFANNPQWRQTSTCAVYYPCLEVQEFIYYVHSDTVINNYTYHRIYKVADVEQNWMAPPPASQCGGSWTDNQEVARLRQDGKKIWSLDGDGTNEELLYDFDLEVGDTLPQTPIQWNDNLIVTGVDSVLIGTEFRKVFEVGSQFLAEGIGHNEGFLEPFPAYLECGYEFLCFTLNGTTYFPDQQTQCDLTVGIDELRSERMAGIYPNPTADGMVTVELDQTASVSVTVLNSTGELVRTFQANSGRFECQLPAEKGIYLIQLNWSDGALETLKANRL